MALPNRGLRLLCLCAGVVAASVPAASGGGGLRTYYPVAIIGNGPSALAASALLAGWLPFYRDGCRHPNAPLRNAIQSQLERAARATGRDPIEVSLLELDLRSLAAHVLEAGRSNNPIALLVDSLLHPGGGHRIRRAGCHVHRRSVCIRASRGARDYWGRRSRRLLG